MKHAMFHGYTGPANHPKGKDAGLPSGTAGLTENRRKHKIPTYGRRVTAARREPLTVKED